MEILFESHPLIISEILKHIPRKHYEITLFFATSINRLNYLNCRHLVYKSVTLDLSSIYYNQFLEEIDPNCDHNLWDVELDKILDPMAPFRFENVTIKNNRHLTLYLSLFKKVNIYLWHTGSNSNNSNNSSNNISNISNIESNSNSNNNNNNNIDNTRDNKNNDKKRKYHMIASIELLLCIIYYLVSFFCKEITTSNSSSSNSSSNQETNQELLFWCYKNHCRFDYVKRLSIHRYYSSVTNNGGKEGRGGIIDFKNLFPNLVDLYTGADFYQMVHAENLPRQLKRWRTMSNNLTEKINIANLPCTLEKLDILSRYKSIENIKKLPSDLKILELRDAGIRFSIGMDVLPRGLEKFVFRGLFLKGVQLNQLPQTLTSLEITWRKTYGILDPKLLPRHLKSLSVQGKIIQDQFNCADLPHTLTWLQFYRNVYIKNLIFKNCPPDLSAIDISQCTFENALDFTLLPTYLKYINLPIYDTHPIDIELMPSMVERVTIGRFYTDSQKAIQKRRPDIEISIS